MPFQLGRGAVRRTTEYLDKGKIILRDNVKLMTFNFNSKQRGVEHPHHKGLE